MAAVGYNQNHGYSLTKSHCVEALGYTNTGIVTIFIRTHRYYPFWVTTPECDAGIAKLI